MAGSYCEETLANGESRVVLKLPAALAPIKLDLFTGKLLMLTQVEVRTAMYTLHFLKSERHLELDIRSRVSVVSQLLMIVITILLISQAKSLMPFQTSRLPFLKPLDLLTRTF